MAFFLNDLYGFGAVNDVFNLSGRRVSFSVRIDKMRRGLSSVPPRHTAFDVSGDGKDK
jgi:hypothetical protein